jgi:hypothetical protein
MQGANARLSEAARHYNQAQFDRACRRWSLTLGGVDGGLVAQLGVRF